MVAGSICVCLDCISLFVVVLVLTTTSSLRATRYDQVSVEV